MQMQQPIRARRGAANGIVDGAVAIVTGELVEEQLHRADVQVQLVHVVLTEVTDLQVPEAKR